MWPLKMLEPKRMLIWMWVYGYGIIREMHLTWFYYGIQGIPCSNVEFLLAHPELRARNRALMSFTVNSCSHGTHVRTADLGIGGTMSSCVTAKMKKPNHKNVGIRLEVSYMRFC